VARRIRTVTATAERWRGGRWLCSKKNWRRSLDIQLPETQLTDEDEIEEGEDLDELLPDIYVETATGLLYECKFFDGFVLVRPASPTFYLAIKKMSHVDFSREFEEFSGDLDEARAAIRGEMPGFIVERI
jgi:hypothetical protein